MIKLIKINHNFDSLVLFKDFNASFVEHKINCIIAPSGSGKTTLLNFLSGILKPNEGEIENLIRPVSYVFQDERLIGEINVHENLAFVMKEQFPDLMQRDQRINEYLSLVDLTAVAKAYPRQLSGSMKQRLSFARAFIFRSDVLIMDEPFIGLDMKVKSKIITNFIKLWEKDQRTVIFVTHDIDEALLVSHHISVYSDKPMKLINTHSINIPLTERKIYQPELVDIKKDIYQDIEKW
ncbi:MAG: ATP-binding cassette domain-containing protein [Mycoplasmataceae bacterium]|nr:ATP-binding cassette domain-containing protein [Mycoplasmataceae bacterium]